MSLRTALATRHAFGSTATATTVIVPATAGKLVTIYRMILTVGSPAVTVTLQDTSGAALSQPFAFSAGAWLICDLSYDGEPWWQTTLGLGFQIAQSGTTTIGYDVWSLVTP